MTETTKDRIDREQSEQLAEFTNTSVLTLAPYLPCPVCDGVLRRDGDRLSCWGCGVQLTSGRPSAKQ